jgi:diketogulonate reductase-like aldo/keto reductase
MSILTETYELANGVKIPKMALGTWQIDEDVVSVPVGAALRNGYRHIDTALAYQNEVGVGKAVRESGIPRQELFITTKIPAEIKTYAGAVEAIERSLKNLDVDYIDLLLIHAPRPWNEMHGDAQAPYSSENIAVWSSMEEAYKAGKIRAIGVSNFNVADLTNIIEHCDVKPMVNQIRFFIGYTQEEVTSFCQENGILVEGYSPIATGALLENKTVAEMASKYGKSIPQLCIRYLLQRDVLPLPKSTHEAYIIQNANVDFEISKEDMAYLNSQKM